MEFKLEPANYKLRKIDFNVDGILNPNLKEPFPNTSFFLLLCGKAGSGKTSLLMNLLTNKAIYKNVFDKILLCMPLNSRNSLSDNPLEDLPADQMFEQLGPEIVTKIKEIRAEYDILDKKKKRNRNTLLIIDDCTSQLKQNIPELIELSTNRRHLKLSIILLSQYVRAIPRPVRFQITSLVTFKPANQLDIGVIAEEFNSKPKLVFEDICRFVFEDKHSFLFINKDDDTMYKNLCKIII